MFCRQKKIVLKICQKFGCKIQMLCRQKDFGLKRFFAENFWLQNTPKSNLTPSPLLQGRWRGGLGFSVLMCHEGNLRKIVKNDSSKCFTRKIHAKSQDFLVLRLTLPFLAIFKVGGGEDSSYLSYAWPSVSVFKMVPQASKSYTYYSVSAISSAVCVYKMVPQASKPYTYYRVSAISSGVC